MTEDCFGWFRLTIGRLGVSPKYQGIVKSTVSGVFQDLKLKISEGSDQN